MCVWLLSYLDCQEKFVFHRGFYSLKCHWFHPSPSFLKFLFQLIYKLNWLSSKQKEKKLNQIPEN